MTAIAGFWSFEGEGRAAPQCRRLLDMQSRYGRDASDWAVSGAVAAGRNLHKMLAEDRFDRQPLTSPDGRYLLVADLRIDNREELQAEFGVGASEEAADSRIMLLAWLRWREEAFRRVIGDFAIAVWDSAEERLVLARDTAGERPLHYRRDSGFAAFASLPEPLGRLTGAACVDEEQLAAFVADLPPGGRRSFFRDVALVEPGTVVTIRRGEVAARRYFEPSFQTLRLPRVEDYGDALRQQLDAAVARRLRRGTGAIGAQLSSGFDSSAVTASAASALAAGGETLHAFTSAPRAGFDGAVPAGRMADESGLAARTAALYPNLRHHVLRPGGGSALAMLDDGHAFSGQPVGHVCNNLWWQSIDCEARAQGVTVMLTGEAGNFTFSAGLGLDTLPDLLREEGPGRWWSEARALVRSGQFRWRNVANASFGPFIPERLYGFVRRQAEEPPRFLAARWQGEMRQRLARAGWGVRPARDSRRRRWRMLRLADPGNFRKQALATWGVEERDPTNDRRLVEFCLSLPPQAFLSGGERRPAMLRALEGRVPPALFEEKLRGYQMADWYERIGREEVLASAESLARSGAASAVVDFDAVLAAARAWPQRGWEQRPVIYEYRMNLLRALSAARFAERLSRAGNG